MTEESDRWIHLDGAEPERIRPLLEFLRLFPPARTEESARFEREFFEKLDAQIADAPVTMGGDPPYPPAQPVTMGGDSPCPTATMGEREQEEPSAAISKPRAAEGAGPATEAGATVRSPVLDDRGPAPSVVAVRAPEPVAEAPARAGVPPPPEQWASTAPLPPAVREKKPTLPFMAPDKVPAEKKAARTVPVPVMKSKGMAETAGDDTLTRAMAALPFTGSAGGEAVVAFPRLTLLEYASLCSELSVSPERAGEILPIYHVGSKAAHRALDAHWGRRFGEEAGLRAAFGRHFGEFADWLRKFAGWLWTQRGWAG